MKLPLSKNKTLKFKIFIVSLILFICALVPYAFLKMSMPPMSGEKLLDGLSAPVEIWRDQNGIPHIKAQNNRDGFRALGYVIASERLFQMEMQRRMANGELAEIFGVKGLESDKLFRTLGIKYFSKKLIQKKMAEATYPKEMLEEVQAFYDGINYFQTTHKLPVEFTILGIKPKPFTMADAYAFVGLMGYSFGIALKNEPILSRLGKRIGDDLVEDLRNEKIPTASLRTAMLKKSPEINGDVALNVGSKLQNLMNDLERGFTLFEGSNGWVIAKERSSSGFPILANDPHIQYTQPGIWFEAHLQTPTYESYGHFLSILPFPVLSHNRERGWGLTMSLVDDMDIYQEKIDKINHAYLFKNRYIPLEKRIEVIKVKGQKDLVLPVFSSHHGPILDQVIEDDSLALQWTFYNPENDPLTAIYSMGQAKNMEEFKSAVAMGVSPGLNVLYADRANIGWWIFGEVWKKREYLKRDFILEGSTGDDEIIGTMGFQNKPHEENPASGLIVSANARPKNSDESYLRGDWQPEDRYKTLATLLAQKSKWSPPELMEVQTLSSNFENKLLLSTLLGSIHLNSSEQKKYRESLDILKRWDFISDVEQVAPAIYYSWCKEIEARLWVELRPDERQEMAKTPNGWIFFKRVVLDPQSSWWKKYDREKIFRESLIKVVDDLRQRFGNDLNSWQWGRLHQLEFVHVLGRVKPFDLVFNLGPFPTSGASHEVNNQKSSGLNDFNVKTGPSTRRIIDFAHPENSWGILPTGNSGHLLSPFYGNQVESFLAGKYREQIMDINDNSPSVRFKLKLNPAMK